METKKLNKVGDIQNPYCSMKGGGEGEVVSAAG